MGGGGGGVLTSVHISESIIISPPEEANRGEGGEGWCVDDGIAGSANAGSHWSNQLVKPTGQLVKQTDLPYQPINWSNQSNRSNQPANWSD